MIFDAKNNIDFKVVQGYIQLPVELLFPTPNFGRATFLTLGVREESLLPLFLHFHGKILAINKDNFKRF